MTRSPEDALRDVLHGAGDDPVAGGSFDDVRARARRLDRRSRLLKGGSAAVLLLAIVGVTIPLLTDGDDKPQEVITEPGPEGEKPAPDDKPVGIWPFATAAEADAWDPEAHPDVSEPSDVAYAFVRDIVGMKEAEMSPTSQGTMRQSFLVTSGSPRETTVVVQRMGRSQRWTVVSASSDGLVIDAPGPNENVSSPTFVRGRATAFEGTVLVKVISRDLEPKNLGETFMTGEMGELEPFSGEIGFERDPSGLGAVIAYTTSAEDGSVEQVAAVPIRWSPDGAVGS